MEILNFIEAITWGELLKVAFLAFIGSYSVYFLRKGIDFKAIVEVVGKVVALCLEAESKFAGQGRGEEKMGFVLEMAQDVIKGKGKKFIGKRVFEFIFKKVVVPVITGGIVRL
jgi:hypothetical protein